MNPGPAEPEADMLPSEPAPIEILIYCYSYVLKLQQQNKKKKNVMKGSKILNRNSERWEPQVIITPNSTAI